MKKIISILLLICTLTLCFASCGNSYSEENQNLAVKCAEQKAKQYYFEYLDGKSVGAGKYTDHSTSIKNKEFVDGKYIITVELNYGAKGANANYPGFTVWASMDIEYTVEVTNGSAKIVNTEYITD